MADTPMGFYGKVYRSLRQDGFSVTWYRAITSLRFRLFRNQDRAFVQQHHVETLEDAEINEIGHITGENRSFGFRYVASPVCQVRCIAHSVAQDLRRNGKSLNDCTFIDYGSGKGQALMAAAKFPFREVIGIEFARQLHVQAEKNLHTFRHHNKNTPAIRSIEADATEFELPNNVCLVYLFNPFAESVLRQVLQRVTERLERSEEPVYIMYSQARIEDPEHATSNIGIISSLKNIHPVPIKYHSLFERFLLGSFSISLNKMHQVKTHQPA